MKYYLSSPNSNRQMVQDLNCPNLLLSFGVDAKSSSKHYLDKDVLIDSGAFSIFTIGKKLDINDYLKFIQTLPQHWNFISFDVIPKDKKSKKETEATAEATFENYLFLSKHVKNIVPVYHYGEDFKWVKKYLDYTDYICAGRLLGNLKESIRSYNEVFKITGTKYKVHGLACTDLQLLYKFPFYSVDSITYKKYYIDGSKMYWAMGALKSLSYDNIRYWMYVEQQITKLWKERGVEWK